MPPEVLVLLLQDSPRYLLDLTLASGLFEAALICGLSEILNDPYYAGRAVSPSIICSGFSA
ncbi:MAG: hypothetical protein CBC67_02565 [Gammaproteobacteria bacterium TMED107]|nr:hypothetical protein [Gammaproteobacteria bacterium]OUX76516.1 MAG: hypothetical protein CBC67_02565 [Gammaproteobacteria bacterium TMED107]